MENIQQLLEYFSLDQRGAQTDRQVLPSQTSRLKTMFISSNEVKTNRVKSFYRLFTLCFHSLISQTNIAIPRANKNSRGVEL